jgi:DNA (cytosine-5)-methyltransferase 1
MGRIDYETETMIAHTLRGEGFDASEDGCGRGTPLVPTYTLAIRGRGDSHDLEYRTDGTANAILTPNGGRAGIGVGACCYPINTQIAMRHEALGEGTGLGIGAPGDPGYTLQAGHSHAIAVADTLTSNGDAHSGYRDEKGLVPTGWAVRRLTPTECERLQGFPDGWTDVPYRGKPASDGPRYKALGNSMAVNVMRWIGRRIKLVDALAASHAGSR